MMSSRTVDGVKIGDRGNKALSHEVVMLLKTQDAGYLRTALQKTRLERQKLESSILLDKAPHKKCVSLLSGEEIQGSRKVFVDSLEDQKAFSMDRRKLSREIVEDEESEDEDIDQPLDSGDLDEDLDDNGNQDSNSKESNSREKQAK